MQDYYIYETIYNVDGRNYIGQRHCPINKTLENDNYLGSGKYIKSAINKYGKENFSKRILAICHSQDILDILEMYFISYYKSIEKAEFNIAPGGKGGEGNWTFLSENEQWIIKEKISKANKGKTISEKQRKQLSDKLKGRPSKRRGIKISEELRLKLSIVNKKVFENAEIRKKIGLAVRNSEKFQKSRKDINFRKRMSEINKGRKCSEETKQKIRTKHLGKKMPEGFSEKLSKRMKGRKFTKEHRQKIAISLKGKPKEYLNDSHWYNNGKENYRGRECPSGFVPGRINFNNVGSKGMKWWTNGIEETLSFECPEGFIRGKLPMRQETKEKLRQINLGKKRNS